MRPLGWSVECVDCGCVEVCPDNALDAMGHPTPRELGWLRDHRGWQCEDCGGVREIGPAGVPGAAP